MSAAWKYGNDRKTDGTTTNVPADGTAGLSATGGTATDVPADGAARLSATGWTTTNVSADGAARLSTSDGYSASRKNQM